MPLESRIGGDGLVDVLDRVLDKGIVIDAAVRVSVVGVELLGVDARVVVASIETYLRHAEALAYTDMAAAPLRVRTDPPLFVEPAEPGLAAPSPETGSERAPSHERAALPGSAPSPESAPSLELAPPPASAPPSEPPSVGDPVKPSDGD